MKTGFSTSPSGKPGSKANPKANPETLFAAGYAACFGNALNGIATAQGLDTSESTVTAAVTLGRTDSGVGLAVALDVLIPGVDEATAQELTDGGPRRLSLLEGHARQHRRHHQRPDGLSHGSRHDHRRPRQDRASVGRRSCPTGGTT